MNRPSNRSFWRAALAGVLLLAPVVQAQTTIAGWNFAGLSSYGTSPLSPASSNGNVTVAGLTRGSGLTTSGTAGSNAWGASGWDGNANLAAAVAAGDFATFTLKPNATYKFSLSGISAYNVRRTSAGPTTGQWQYSLDGTTFVNIGTAITWGGTTTGSGNAQSAIDLSGISALQNVPATTTVTFRVVNWSASTSAGTWYLNDPSNTSALDFSVSGFVQLDVPDTDPPTLASLSPVDNAINGSPIANLVATFSEPVVKIPGSGSIELRKADNSLVEAFPIDSVPVSLTTLALNPTVDLDFNTSYYVVFVPTTPGTAMIEDTSGNDFLGLTTSTEWNFTTEPPTPVVINKYLNTSPDVVELLVVGNGTPGTAWDLRGMIIKDFTNNGTDDGGGKYQFSTNALWSAVPVGTLVVLSESASSPDVVVGSGDFNLSVGLDDTTYFSSLGGSFDISTRDFIMIKRVGGGASGITGGMHALAGTDGSPAPALFNAFTGAKLLSSATTGTGVAAIAGNSTSSLADYSGTDATSATLSVAAFGSANNPSNLVYINLLRGVPPSDGSGIATLTNQTSPYTGTNVFPSNAPGVLLQIDINAQLPGGALTDIEVTLPPGYPVPDTITLDGPGAVGASSDLVGSVLTVSGANVTNINNIKIILGGTTPTTTVADNGNLTFTVKTAISGGTLTTIATQPKAYVVIPIEALRDVDANGVPLDLGTTVAVEGVCTEAKFFASNTVAHIQSGGYGMTIFNSDPNSPFVRGKKYVVLGTVSQFNGVTQVVPATFANVLDLGVDTEPAPLVISITDLFLNPEAYEGRLITIENISRSASDTDIWGSNATITMEDSGLNAINVFVASGSGATSGPTGAVNITGIFSQDDTSSPFTALYRVMPREQSDIVSLGSPYDTWIDGFYPGEGDQAIIGFNADPDKDGIRNGIEALIGGEPDVPGVFGASGMTKTGATFSFIYTRANPIPAGVSGGYEWSIDLTNWQSSGASFGGVTVTISDSVFDAATETTDLIQVDATVTAGTADQLFVRVVAND